MVGVGTVLRVRDAMRPFRSLRGYILVADFVRRRFTDSGIVVNIDDFDGDLKLRLSLAESMQSQIFWFGYYSRDVCAVMKRLVRKGMVVVDAGANIGEITMVASKLVGADGHVYSFEPMTGIASQLEENLRANGISNTSVLRVGLSSDAGRLPIYLADGAFRDGSIHDGLGTLYATPERSRKVEEIRLTTLDLFARDAGLCRLDLLKLDVEGAELPALSGARETLTRFKPHLIIEVQDETSASAGYRAADILEFLEPFGYRFDTIGRMGRLHPLNAKSLRDFQNVLCTPVGRAPPER